MKKTLLIILAILLTAGAIFYKADIPVETLRAMYASEESRFMAIDGMDVHYRIEGSGFPLVLIHGTSASLHTWDAWTELLKDDFTVIRMDLPAFGLTGPNAASDYSMEVYSQFMAKFLTSLGVDSCYMAGNSLGGAIAWNFALDYPDKVAKLILIDAAGYPREAASAPLIFKLAQNKFAAAILKNITPRFMVANNLMAVYHDDTKVTEELTDRYYHLLLRQGNREAFISRGKAKFKDRSMEIGSIQQPTLILWGQHDTWIPVENAFKFQQNLPNSKLIIYDDAGHVPMEEIPTPSANDARSFLLQ